MTIDLSLIPFSRRGSYLAVSHLGPMQAHGDRSAGLWIRTVRELFRPGALFRIDVGEPGPVSFTDDTRPEELHLTSSTGGSVRIGFDEPECLRIRVRGCVVRLRAP